MRLLTLFLCVTLTACSGPNGSTEEKGQQSQDSSKTKFSQDNQSDHKLANNIDSTAHEKIPYSGFNASLSAVPIKGKTGENQKKLPVLTQENVVPILTEFGRQNPHNKVLIKTSYGQIKIELFEETPLHRANFLYLIQQDYFTNTFFHRIVPNFIIQGGNSDLRSTPRKRKLIGPNYLLPSEINPNRIHTYGTISGAKEYRENPDKLSAPYEFFIFCGPDISGRHLNGNYTIFGQVTQGMDVVETIANLPADEGEWPKSNVYIEVSIDK